MDKTTTRSSENATRVKRTAEIHKVSTRYVQLVIIGDRIDEPVLATYMQLQELEAAAVDIARKTALIKSVEKAVAF